MIRSMLRSGLLAPLLLVAMLAGALGFVAARELAGDANPGRGAQLSVVPLPATPTPKPTPKPTPEVTASPDPSAPAGRTSRTGRTERRPRVEPDPQCPAGCECSYPAGGVVVVCRGQ